MFKSLFKKKKENPGPSEDANDQPNESHGDDREQQSSTSLQHINEVLKILTEELSPWDREHYSVAVSEAQYAWARYQQLLQNNNKYITDDILSIEPFSSSYILQQVWKTIPRDDNGCVTFPSFFGVIKWWQTVDQETKLRCIFKLLNKSQPLNAAILKTIFIEIDVYKQEEVASHKAELLVSHLDDKNQGFIDEEQWIQGMRRLSDNEINELTRINILPTSPEPSVHAPTPSLASSSPIPDGMLIKISSKIGEKDWKLLAKRLGFDDREIKSIVRQYPNRSREQTFQMLKTWNEKDNSTKQKLEFALRRSGMDEVLFSLQNE